MGGPLESWWLREERPGPGAAAMERSPLWGFPGGLAGGWHGPGVGRSLLIHKHQIPASPPGNNASVSIRSPPLQQNQEGRAPEEGVMNCLLERYWHEEEVEPPREDSQGSWGKVEPPFTREDGVEMTGKKPQAAGGWKTGCPHSEF